MMTAEQAGELVGIPYENGAYGPNSFNCWGLLYYVQKEYFNVKMPRAPLGNADQCRLMFDTRINSGQWTSVEVPRHGDGALLRGGDEPHVGIYLDFDGGGILHALEGVGVIFTTLDQLRTLGFARTKYYRLTNDG